jgi:hypothetical protein
VAVTPDQLASLAQSLKDNEAFQGALAQIRANALERLATLPHSEAEAFYSAQARVAVVDELRDNLEQFIRSGAEKKKPGLA